MTMVFSIFDCNLDDCIPVDTIVSFDKSHRHHSHEKQSIIQSHFNQDYIIISIEIKGKKSDQPFLFGNLGDK